MKNVYRIILMCIIGVTNISLLTAEEFVSEKTPHSLIPAREQQQRMSVSPYTPPKGIWRWAIGGGYSYRLAERQKQGSWELREMENSLMHGFNVMMDLQYFVRPFWGFGITTNLSRSKANLKNLPYNIYGNSYYREAQEFFFIAPSFAMKVDFGNYTFVGDVAIGALAFWDTVTLTGTDYKGNRATVGFNMGAALETKVSPSAALGLKLSWTIGTIDSITLNGGWENIYVNDRISLSNLMVTGFISFCTP